MPADSTVVTGPEVMEAVRRLVADVLIVPLERVEPDSILAADLGAESIDYLDLVFRLEDVVGRSIPISNWQQYLNRRFGTASLTEAITTRVVVEFALECRVPIP
jgi:acyl carrier protein